MKIHKEVIRRLGMLLTLTIKFHKGVKIALCKFYLTFPLFNLQKFSGETKNFIRFFFLAISL